jgi:hypothetical protein
MCLWQVAVQLLDVAFTTNYSVAYVRGRRGHIVLNVGIAAPFNFTTIIIDILNKNLFIGLNDH